MNNFLQYKRKNTGFTLIELIVTITIVGIFASYAVPSFSNLLERNRVTAATNQLVSALTMARSESLKRSNTVTLCQSTTQTACTGGSDFSKGWIVFLDCDDNGVRAAGAVDCDGDGVAAAGEGEQIVKVQDLLYGVYIANNIAGNNIGFNFAGRSNNPSTFNVGVDPSDLRTDLVVSRVGRLRSQGH